MAKKDNDLMEELRQLHEIIRDQEREIAELKKKLESGKKTVRVWKIQTCCKHCRRRTENHVSFIDNKIYVRTKYSSLVSLLRKMGYLVDSKGIRPSLKKTRVCKELVCREADLSKVLEELDIPDYIDDKLFNQLMGKDDNQNGAKEENKR